MKTFIVFVLLEDVPESGIRARTRVHLLQDWIQRKLRRDRLSWAVGGVVQRLEVREGLDIEDFIPVMLQTMERIAFAMSVRSDHGTTELLESVDAATVRAIAAEVFGEPAPTLLPLLLNSLLVIYERREGGNHRIGFALRVVHEFLLASYFKRQRLDASGLPESVQALFGELQAADS